MKKKMAWAGIFLALFFVMLPAAQMVVAHAEVHGTMHDDGSFTVDPYPVSAVSAPVAAPTLSAGGIGMTVPAGSPAAVPVTNTEGGHWWSGLLSTVLAALAAGLTALITWVSKNAKDWIAQKASEQSTKESAAWYMTAIYFAKIAVNFAKNKYGSGTPTQMEIVASAKKWLKDRLAALDPDILDPKKNPDLDGILEGLILAVYNLPFEVASPLVAAPASKPV